MTKTLPTGCIKDNKDRSWETFNFLLEIVLTIQLGTFT